jgi:hypothetical protein
MNEPVVQTVLKRIPSPELGVTLPHIARLGMVLVADLKRTQ